MRDVHRFMGNFVVKNLDDEEDDGFREVSYCCVKMVSVIGFKRERAPLLLN